jgi:fucose 4-O-acetylase-like acetyltransferase
VTPPAVDVRSTAPVGSPTASKSPRDPWFDNVKYVLIVLVVVGHVIGTFRNQVPGAAAVYAWIYSFHMPAFVFLAGLFSRGSGSGHRQTTSLFSRVLVPYLVFEVLYSLWHWRLEGGDLEVSPFVPHWLMWFLLALFLWRLAAPHLVRLRYPLATSVVVALGAGLVPDLDRYLTLHRVLALLPFFVLGLVVRPHHLELLRTRGAQVAALVALAAALPVSAWAADGLAMRWFYHRSPYVDLDAGVVEGLLTRGAILATGMALTAAVLALVPRRGGPLSARGASSMYPYLLHGFVVMGLEASGVTDQVTTVPLAVVAVASAVAGTFLLSSRPVRWLTRPFVAPPTAWLFQPAAEPTAAGAADPVPAPGGARKVGEISARAATASARARPGPRAS